MYGWRKAIKMDIKISNTQPNFRARLYTQNIRFKPKHYKKLIKYANTIGSASDKVIIKKNMIKTIVNGNSRKTNLNILDINEDSRVQKIKETVNNLLKPTAILAATAVTTDEILDKKEAPLSNIEQQEDIPTNTTIQTPQAVPKVCLLPKKYKYTFNTLLEYLKEKYGDMEFTTNPNIKIDNVEGDFDGYEMSRDCPYDSNASLERFLGKVFPGKYILNTWKEPPGFYLCDGYPRTESYLDYGYDYGRPIVCHYTDRGLVLPGRRIDKYKMLFEGKNRVKEGFFDEDKYIFDEYNWSVTCIEERKNCTIKKTIKKTGEYPHYYFPNKLISKEIETKNSKSILSYYDDDFMLSSKIFKDEDKIVAFSISNFKDFKVISHEKARDFMIIKYPDSEDIIIKSENDNQEYRVSARNLKELKENVYFS